MTTPIQILVTGATGYVGGSVVDRLIKHPNAANFIITALVRSPEKAQKLQSLGLKTAIGSYDDTALLQDLSAQSDIVFLIANIVDENPIHGILAGLKKRYNATGVPPSVFHTSGTAIMSDAETGMNAGEIIYSDTDAEAIESIPLIGGYRKAGAAVVAADKEGYVKSYIICPGNVWGIASGTLADIGVQNLHSKLIPIFLKVSAGRKAAGMAGLGKNIWVHVNVDDLADLYINLLDAIQTKSGAPHGREGYYFAENGEASMYQFGKAIGEALVTSGKIVSSEPTSFDEQELKMMPLLKICGTNQRCRGNHSRAVGWKPAKDVQAMFASIRYEL